MHAHTITPECLNRPRMRKHVVRLFHDFVPRTRRLGWAKARLRRAHPLDPDAAPKWWARHRTHTRPASLPTPTDRSYSPPRKSALEAHHIADDFGDRVIVLDRDFVVDLHGGVQGAGQS